jgi:hypothetical protein
LISGLPNLPLRNSLNETAVMRADVEIYKGIEFVRLSSLPSEQNKMISDSAIAKKIIKILRGNELLNDCIPYNLYLEWHRHHFGPEVEVMSESSAQIKKLRLVFK